jgi:hypothetical protein
MADTIAEVAPIKGYRQHSIEEYAAALTDTKGMVSQAARRLGISQQAVRQRVAKSPQLQQVLADAREAMTDTAELALYSKIVAGEGWAVCFYLKTQGKERGYVERTEVTGAGGGDITVRAVDYRDGLRALAPPEAGDG